MPEPDSVPAAWPGQKRVPGSCNVNKTLSVAFSEAFSDFPGIFVFVTMGPSVENKTTARQVCSHQGVADSSLSSKTAQDTEKDPISNKQKQVRNKNKGKLGVYLS